MAKSKGRSNERFTAWISAEERRRIKEKAERVGTSENLIVRFAIRRYFGMELPEEAEKDDARRTRTIPVSQEKDGQS